MQLHGCQIVDLCLRDEISVCCNYRSISLTIAYVYSFHACLCRLDLIASANNSLYKSTTIKAYAIHSWIRLLHIINSVLIIQQLRRHQPVVKHMHCSTSLEQGLYNDIRYIYAVWFYSSKTKSQNYRRFSMMASNNFQQSLWREPMTCAHIARAPTWKWIQQKLILYCEIAK